MNKSWIDFGLGFVAGSAFVVLYQKGCVHDFFEEVNRKIDSLYD